MRDAVLRKMSVAMALSATLALVACGDDNEKTVTKTVESTTGAKTTSADKQVTSTAEATSGGEQATPLAARRKVGPKYFETPSGNIGCYVAASAARCDIKERDWEPPPIPKYCVKAGVDFGQGIAVGKTGVSFVCAGDTAFGGPATLGYGQVSQRGIFRCESELSGITCNNLKNAAGFFLSREEYRIF